jgi:hypothetical protein
MATFDWKEVKDFQISSTGSDDTQIAAVSGKKIRVLSYVMSAAAATVIKWQSTTSNQLSGYGIAMAANSTVVAPHNPSGWFETNAGELLNIENSNSEDVGGHGTYVEIG